MNKPGCERQELGIHRGDGGTSRLLGNLPGPAEHRDRVISRDQPCYGAATATEDASASAAGQVKDHCVRFEWHGPDQPPGEHPKRK